MGRGGNERKNSRVWERKDFRPKREGQMAYHWHAMNATEMDSKSITAGTAKKER